MYNPLSCGCVHYRHTAFVARQYPSCNAFVSCYCCLFPAVLAAGIHACSLSFDWLLAAGSCSLCTCWRLVWVAGIALLVMTDSVTEGPYSGVICLSVEKAQAVTNRLQAVGYWSLYYWMSGTTMGVGCTVTCDCWFHLWGTAPVVLTVMRVRVFAQLHWDPAASVGQEPPDQRLVADQTKDMIRLDSSSYSAATVSTVSIHIYIYI